MNPKVRSFVLWIGVPLCLVLAATGLQLFWPGVYWREAQASVAGALASDMVDLFLVFPILAIATIFTARGSRPALLIWMGTLGFLVYNFLIYVFEVHFNAMFLAYCAVLGLSIHGLLGMRECLDPEEIAKTYDARVPRKTTAVAFLVLAVLAAGGEVKEIVRAIRAGTVPPSVVETGQRTDPIHVLDLCFLLPLVATAGILLLRRRPMGYVLAPALMVTLVLISLEVITILVVFESRGLPANPAPLISFGVCAVSFTALLVWFLRSTHKTPRQAGMSA